MIGQHVWLVAPHAGAIAIDSGTRQPFVCRRPSDAPRFLPRDGVKDPGAFTDRLGYHADAWKGIREDGLCHTCIQVGLKDQPALSSRAGLQTSCIEYGDPMFDRYMILPRGFKNVKQGGTITGFQLDVRITYYRGIPLSCVEGFDVTVDDETFGMDKIKYSLGGRTYTPAEAENATTVRWPFGDALTLIVEKPDGLKLGIHDVQVSQKLRISYHPDPAKPGGPVTGSENPSVHTDKKRMTLVW